ncbi:hypothetical protein [Arthrobacter sp. NPDC090010]|uniref:hypothetical protein n=1 Tax=Arthrobacter sp. NPDC090010 TaxID=3363942 RepID=UPI0037FFD22B
MSKPNSVKNLFLGAIDVQSGTAGPVKARRQAMIAGVIGRSRALSETVQAVKAFDSMGNAVLVAQQIRDVAEVLASAANALADSIDLACAAGPHVTREGSGQGFPVSESVARVLDGELPVGGEVHVVLDDGTDVAIQHAVRSGLAAQAENVRQLRAGWNR